MQFSRDRLRPGSSCLRRRLEHRKRVLTQCIANPPIGVVHVVVAANLAPFVHDWVHLDRQSSYRQSREMYHSDAGSDRLLNVCAGSSPVTDNEFPCIMATALSAVDS